MWKENLGIGVSVKRVKRSELAGRVAGTVVPPLNQAPPAACCEGTSYLKTVCVYVCSFP